MISTSILNKKKIHDIGCTPLFELGWNDPEMDFDNFQKTIEIELGIKLKWRVYHFVI